jgi:hypothetical protein
MRKLAILLLAGSIVLSGQRTRTAPVNGVVSKLLRTLMEETNPEQAERDVRTH